MMDEIYTLYITPYYESKILYIMKLIFVDARCSFLSRSLIITPLAALSGTVYQFD